MHDSAMDNDLYIHLVCFAVDLNEYTKVEKIQKIRMCIGLVKVKWLRHDSIAY